MNIVLRFIGIVMPPLVTIVIPVLAFLSILYVETIAGTRCIDNRTVSSFNKVTNGRLEVTFTDSSTQYIGLRQRNITLKVGDDYCIETEIVHPELVRKTAGYLHDIF